MVKRNLLPDVAPTTKIHFAREILAGITFVVLISSGTIYIVILPWPDPPGTPVRSRS